MKHFITEHDNYLDSALTFIAVCNHQNPERLPFHPFPIFRCLFSLLETLILQERCGAHGNKSDPLSCRLKWNFWSLVYPSLHGMQGSLCPWVINMTGTFLSPSVPSWYIIAHTTCQKKDSTIKGIKNLISFDTFLPLLDYHLKMYLLFKWSIVIRCFSLK